MMGRLPSGSGLLDAFQDLGSLSLKKRFCRVCEVKLKQGEGVEFRNGWYCDSCARKRKMIKQEVKK